VIEVIEGLPDPVVGLRFSGHVTRSEYKDVVLPVFAPRLEGDQNIRMLVVIDERFERFEPGALWEDLKFGLGSGVTHLTKWERTAVVADTDWVRHAMGLLGWMIPGDTRVFDLAQLDEAKAWLTR
jgi:hypothetical protein